MIEKPKFNIFWKAFFYVCSKLQNLEDDNKSIFYYKNLPYTIWIAFFNPVVILYFLICLLIRILLISNI